MARRLKAKPNEAVQPNNSLVVKAAPDETSAQAMARKLLQPSLKNAVAASSFMGKMLGTGQGMPGLHDYATHVQSVA